MRMMRPARQATGKRLWAADIPGMNTFVCDEQMLNILDDGTIIISGGTHGGGVFAYSGSSPIDPDAPTPKFGMDEMLTGTWKPSGKPPAPGPGKKNECNPTKGCNVCDECCEPYIPDGTMCDACVSKNCMVKKKSTVGIDVASSW